MNTAKQIWADHLRHCLTTGGGLSTDAVNSIMGRFEVAVAKHAPEQVFRSLLDAYGNQDVGQACASVREKLQHALEQANSRTVETNRIVRVREAIRRLNANLDKCGGVTVDGREIGAKPSKVRVPECLREKTYEAEGMVLEVRF